MSAEKFKKDGKYTFDVDGITGICQFNDFGMVTVIYYVDGVRNTITLPTFMKFINMLEYADKYDDNTFTRAFIISLTEPSQKIGRIFEIFTLVERLRDQPHVVWGDIDITAGSVCVATSWGERIKNTCSKNAILRWINMNISKIGCTTHVAEFVWVQNTIYTNIRYDNCVAQYNLEEAITALLPQPIAEEICEYLF